MAGPDLCALLGEPGPLASAVARAHGGAWLPQELLARRETLRHGQAQLRRQLERLTDAYLRAVIPLDEYERRRRDLEQRVQALAGQEEQLRCDAARRQQLAGVAASVEAFRARVQRGLAEASFEQRRQLVLLLVDRVVVTEADVEIRYVLPTSAESERVRFCHLRKDYFEHPVQPVLNGLLTNDKFCLSRPGGRLTLRRWRPPTSRRGRDHQRSSDLPDTDGDRGGAHAAPVASPPPDAAGPGRGTPVGPGLPADRELEPGRRPADTPGAGHLLPTAAGGGR